MQDLSSATLVGERVVAIRAEKGLTQQTLAHESGTALRTIQRIEQGEDVRLNTLGRVAEALGVTLGDLFAAPTEVSPS